MPPPNIQRRKEEEEEKRNLPVTQSDALMQSVQENVQQGRETVLPAIVDTVRNVRSANDSLLATQRRLAGERNPIMDDMRAAQDRLFNIEQNPEIVNNILGLFDSDFNRDAQIRRMQRGKFELSSLTNRMQEAEVVRNVEIQNATTELTATTDFYEFTRQGILDQQSAMLVGFQIRDNVRREQVQQVQDTTKEQLLKWETNPDTMPRSLNGLGRLVTAELFRRKVDEAQLSSIDIANTRNREALFDEQRENFMDQFNSIEELQAAANEFSRNPDSAPKYIRPNDWVKEEQKRVSIDMSFRSAQQSIEANDLTLGDAHKRNALAQMSLTDLNTVLINAGDKASVDIMGVPISKNELTLAIAAKRDAQIKQGIVNAELIATINAVATLKESVVSSAMALGQMNNPYGEPELGLPPSIRGALQGVQNLDKHLSASVAQGDVGAAIVQSKQWKAVDEKMQAEIDRVVKDTPKDSRSAVSEYLNNGGVVTSSVAAGGYLIQNAPNIFELDADPLLKNGYRGFSKLLSELSGNDRTLTFGGDSFSVSDNDKENAGIVNQAIIDSNLRGNVADAGFQMLLQNTLVKLASTPDGASIDPDSPYAALITSQGTLSQSMYAFTPGGERQFMYDNLFAALSNAQITAEANGTINPGDTLVNPVIDMMRQNATSLNSGFTASPTAAALRKAAFPDGVQGLIYERLAAMSAELPGIVQNAKDNQLALQNALREEMQNLEQAP